VRYHLSIRKAYYHDSLKSLLPHLSHGSSSLRAVTLRAPSTLAVEELPVPSLHGGDLLIEMRACGLCGTDIEKLRGGYTAAMPVLGHEAVGVVVKLGEGVTGFQLNDRVFPHHHVACGICHYCRHGSETMCSRYKTSNLDPGGFSEYFRVPEWNVSRGAVIKLPDNISFEEASLIEPTACCIRALERVNASEGESALVVGAGPIGLTHAQILLNMDIKVFVSDISHYRLEFARMMNPHRVFNAAQTDVPSKVREETDSRGADFAVVASGSPQAIVQALRSVRKGGRVCLFGVPFKGSKLDYDISEIFNAELSLISSYGATEKEIQAALELIANRRINLAPLITHRYRIDEFEEAIQTAEKGNCMKIIIVP
jgi:L-iditol 2-dehydrogenase